MLLAAVGTLLSVIQISFLFVPASWQIELTAGRSDQDLASFPPPAATLPRPRRITDYLDAP